MNGTPMVNSSARDEKTALPLKPSTLTFLPQEVTIEVDPSVLPFGDHGQPGSILDIAMGHDIDT